MKFNIKITSLVLALLAAPFANAAPTDPSEKNVSCYVDVDPTSLNYGNVQGVRVTSSDAGLKIYVEKLFVFHHRILDVNIVSQEEAKFRISCGVSVYKSPGIFGIVLLEQSDEAHASFKDMNSKDFVDLIESQHYCETTETN
jgi:hypothetical protein